MQGINNNTKGNQMDYLYLNCLYKGVNYYLCQGQAIFQFYRNEGICPCCGMISEKKSSHKINLQRIIDFPFTDKNGKLHQVQGISVSEFVCTNPECEKYGKSFIDALHGYLINNQDITSHFWDFICILQSIMGPHIYVPIITGLLSDVSEDWEPNNLVTLGKEYAENHPLLIDGENVLLINKSRLAEMPMRQSHEDYSNFITICIEKFLQFYTYEDYKEMLFAYVEKNENMRTQFYKKVIETLEAAADEDVRESAANLTKQLMSDKKKNLYILQLETENKTLKEKLKRSQLSGNERNNEETILYIKQLEDENRRLLISNRSLRTNNKGLLRGVQKLQRTIKEIKEKYKN